MRTTIQSKELLADVDNLSKAANTIKEETCNFENDLKKLEQCIAELNSYWEGDAAKSFQSSILVDFYELNEACAVFKKLSGDYSFAVNEYRKNEQKSIDIVRAIKDI